LWLQEKSEGVIMNQQEIIKAIVEDINNGEYFAICIAEDECGLIPDESREAIVSDLNGGDHRWYRISTSVYKLGDLFFGIRGASNLFSESIGWEDAYVKCEAFEMEQVQSVTYTKVVK